MPTHNNEVDKVKQNINRRKSQWLQWCVIFLIVFSFIGAIGVLGDWLLARYIVGKQFGTDVSNDWRQTMIYDSYQLYRGKPNIKKIQVSREDGRFYYHVTHNSYGMRTPEFKQEKNAFRILTVGDSTTWGYGVEDDETWPYQLQQYLDPSCTKIEVINAGVVGYSAFQVYRYLKREGMKLKPDIVLVTTGFNDASATEFHDTEDIHYSVGYTQKLLKILLQRENSVVKSLDNKPRLKPQEYHDFLVNIADLCKVTETRLFFLDWPNLHTLVDPELHPSYSSQIYQACKDTSAKPINIYEMVSGLLEPIFLDICHFSTRGNQLAAAYIAEEIRFYLPESCRTYENKWTFMSKQYKVGDFWARDGIDALLNRCAFLDAWMQQYHSIWSVNWETARIGMLIPEEHSMLAEYTLRRAAEMVPHIAPVFFRLDEIFNSRYGKQGCYDEWERMSKIMPYSTVPAVFYLMSKIRKDQGNTPEALKLIENALKKEHRIKYLTLQESIKQQL